MKRKIALLLALSVVICFVIFGTLTEIAGYHDCCGEHCPICLALSLVRNMLQNLLPIGACVVCDALLLRRLIAGFAKESRKSRIKTPVSRFDLMLD